MKNQYTPQDVKLAYQIVSHDLSNALLGSSSDISIKLGSVGKLIKQEKEQRCGWDGVNYTYCSLKFKPFKKLKEALNKQIISKYRK